MNPDGFLWAAPGASTLLTITLNDDSIIAAFLRLCPPTCPTATSKEHNIVLEGQ
jgi:hypothetical protein